MKKVQRDPWPEGTRVIIKRVRPEREKIFDDINPKKMVQRGVLIFYFVIYLRNSEQHLLKGFPLQGY